MMSKSTTFAVIILAVALAAAAHAQGTSGSQFLGVGLGARATAMGGAYVSLADDGTALYWNPAGLTQVEGASLTLSHISWFSDATYQYAGYATSFGRNAALGAFVEQGSISWDNTGEGDFEAGDFAGVVGYGRRLKPNLGVGGGVKFLSSSLGETDASSYALDLGVVYRPTESATVGAAVRNLGPGLSFEDESDPLPTTMVVGGSYVWRGLLLSADLEKVNDLSVTPRVGVEYAPVKHLALRGGWAGGGESALSSLSGGVGLTWNDRWALDYAYRDSDLGGTHQFGISAGFGGGGGLMAAASNDESGGPGETRMPQSNLSVITELAHQIATEALDSMPVPGEAMIHTRQVESHDANWLIKSILLEELTSRGHIVRAGQMSQAPQEGDSGGRPTFELAYRIVTCETTLPRAWREWMVGSQKVERRTAIDLRFELSDETKAIIWADGFQRERREIIPGSRVRDLSAPGQSFASPETEPGGWDKVFEPVIVAGIVGGLIYLFYTSRTTD